jgi:hypothetical protein
MNGENSEDEINSYSIKRKSSMYVNVQTYWCFVQLFRSLFLDIRWWWRIEWLCVTWSWLSITRRWLSVLLLSCCVHPCLVDWLNYCANRLLLCKSHLKNYNFIERRDFICAVYVDRSKLESCLYVWYLWHADDAQLLSTAVDHFTSFGPDQLKLKLN